jgi:hypothetical protein
MNTYPTRTIPTGAIHCVAPGCRYKPKTDTALAEEDLAGPIPRFALAGADLCEYHVRRFASVLGDLVGDAPSPVVPGADDPKWWADPSGQKWRRTGLLADLQQSVVRRGSSTQNTDAAGVRSSNVRDVGDSWNPHAAAVLYQIREWTTFLVRVIHRDRPLTGENRWMDEAASWWAPYPRDVGLGVDPHAPTGVNLEVIRRHHARWLAMYPTLGPALLDDVVRHRAAALRALDAPTVRRLALRGHFCPADVGETEDGVVLECRGQLVAIIRDPTATTKPTEIVCEVNPDHAVPRTSWMTYATAG